MSGGVLLPGSASVAEPGIKAETGAETVCGTPRVRESARSTGELLCVGVSWGVCVPGVHPTVKKSARRNAARNGDPGKR